MVIEEQHWIQFFFWYFAEGVLSSLAQVLASTLCQGAETVTEGAFPGCCFSARCFFARCLWQYPTTQNNTKKTYKEKYVRGMVEAQLWGVGKGTPRGWDTHRLPKKAPLGRRHPPHSPLPHNHPAPQPLLSPTTVVPHIPSSPIRP